MNWTTCIIALMVIVYNLILVLCTGYLVFFKDYSGWWFLITWILTIGVSNRDTKKKKTKKKIILPGDDNYSTACMEDCMCDDCWDNDEEEE